MAEADARIGMMEEEEGENSPVAMRRRMYKCKYCDRTFATSQALGGHQNGHRSEREAVRKAQRDADVFGAQPPPPPPPPPSSVAQFFSSRVSSNPYVQSHGSYFPPPYYYPSASIRNQLRYHPYNYSRRYASQAFDKLFATSSSAAAPAVAAPPPPPPPPPPSHPFAYGFGSDWSRRVSAAKRLSIYDMNWGARPQVGGADARRETKPDGDGEIDLTLRL